MSGSTPIGPPDDGHADDLVSALLDGELDAETATWVDAHLATCGPCREAAAHARLARTLLRDLPSVDGSAVVRRFLARHRAVVRTGAAFVAAAAVVIAALGLTSAVVRPEVVPPVEQLVAAHDRAVAADAASTEDVGTALRSTGVEEMVGMRWVDEVDRPYSAPTALLGQASARGQARLVRHAVFDGRDLTLVLYRNGRAEVSVFEQPGRLRWDELGAGRFETVGTRQVWVREGTPVVAITEIGHLVVTIVSDDRTAVRMVAAGLPEKRRGSTLDRLHDACVRFTRTFAGGG